MLTQSSLCFGKWLSTQYLLACGSVAEGCLACQFAPTQMEALTLLVQTEFHGLEMSSLVRGITEGLVLREATRTVEVVLCAEDWLVYDVGADLG